MTEYIYPRSLSHYVSVRLVSFPFVFMIWPFFGLFFFPRRRILHVSVLNLVSHLFVHATMLSIGNLSLENLKIESGLRNFFCILPHHLIAPTVNTIKYVHCIGCVPNTLAKVTNQSTVCEIQFKNIMEMKKIYFNI